MVGAAILGKPTEVSRRQHRPFCYHPQLWIFVIHDMAFRLIPGNVLSLEDGTVEV